MHEATGNGGATSSRQLRTKRKTDETTNPYLNVKNDADWEMVQAEPKAEGSNKAATENTARSKRAPERKEQKHTA